MKDFVEKICILSGWAILLITITAWPGLGQIDSVPTAGYEDYYDDDTNYYDLFSMDDDDDDVDDDDVDDDDDDLEN